MVGGFLGAGKTTAIGRLAAMYRDRGLNVGIVTNDQAEDLVDTHTLRGMGFEVGEVAGACFCCRFEDLVETAAGLGEENRPDVILAEPVGSCTDLVATVVRPLQSLYADEIEVGPFSVVLKPSHGARVLRSEEAGPRSGFSPKAEYILRKQIEEADAILINRVDELTPAKVAALEVAVRRLREDIAVMPISAATGAGFDEWVSWLDSRPPGGGADLEIDYDTYAEGEAELAWLNRSIAVASDRPWDVDRVILRLVAALKEMFAGRGAETAHLKIVGLADGFFGVANLISGDGEPTLSQASGHHAREAEIVVNARVAGDPSHLEADVTAAIEAVCLPQGLTVSVGPSRAFRPGRPEPTHRMSAR